MSRLSNRGRGWEGTSEWQVHPCLSIGLVASLATPLVRVASRSRLQPRTRINDLGGRVILGIADDDDSTSAGFDLVALRNALHRVVRSLGMKIGTNFANDGAHILFRENDDRVHVRQRTREFPRAPPPALPAAPHPSMRARKRPRSPRQSVCRPVRAPHADSVHGRHAARRSSRWPA